MAGTPVILLVDDDEDSIVLLENALEWAKVANRQVVARNGQEAIDYLSGSGPYADREKFPQPELMLLDLKMPEVDGFDVLEWCRQNTEAKDLNIVVMTGSTDRSDRERAMSLGASAYYVKPLRLSDLKKIAQEVKERWLDGGESHSRKR